MTNTYFANHQQSMETELEEAVNAALSAASPDPVRVIALDLLDKVSPFAAWLLRSGAVEVLADALSPLCDGDPKSNPHGLGKVEAVGAALEGSLPKFCGAVSHAASLEAARLEAAAPFALDPTVDEETRRVIERALALEAAETKPMTAESTGRAGAESLYAADGIKPWKWGVSKGQLALFLAEVRAAHDAGKIQGQPDPSKPFYYPQEKFDSLEVGPNMHQVNASLIKPATRGAAPLPGLSWALAKNLKSGGRRCDLFFSHGALS